ncbi:MAG TPA: Amuc_1100 family pilus-like protein [Verrucomicrobiae bacterium]|nr:Amuc_1100 family pilus-like protein [Verrucomicrobiae bacterium]
MNLKWLKQHALAVGFAAAFLIVLGVLIWLQQAAASSRAEVDGNLQEQQSQYQHLLEQKPTPTRETIEALKQDREQLQQMYGQLLSNVSHTVEVPSDIRPVDFLQLMASAFSRLRQAAAGAGIKFPDGFAFGFERYAGPIPTLPAKNLSPEDTKRTLTLLVKQLNAIEQISMLLISNRVSEITQVRRAEVETGAGGTPGGDSLEAAMKTDPNALYQVLPFEFQFKCSGEALRDVLNSLTKANSFLAVRRVQVTGEAPGSAATVMTAGMGMPSLATAATTTSNPDLLTVTMRIDLIEFPAPKPARKGPGA